MSESVTDHAEGKYILPLNARGLTKRQLCDKCNYKYRDRIGRKATMNSGETCRIIAYRSSMDLGCRV